MTSQTWICSTRFFEVLSIGIISVVLVSSAESSPLLDEATGRADAQAANYVHASSTVVSIPELTELAERLSVASPTVQYAFLRPREAGGRVYFGHEFPEGELNVLDESHRILWIRCRILEKMNGVMVTNENWGEFSRRTPSERYKRLFAKCFGNLHLFADKLLATMTRSEKIEFAKCGFCTDLSVAALERMSEDSEQEIRLLVALNLNTPIDAILRMGMRSDNDEKVRFVIEKRRSYLDPLGPVIKNGRRFREPLQYDAFPEIRIQRISDECHPFRENDRLLPGSYQTIGDARNDLVRIFSGWVRHPESTASACCIAVDQVLALSSHRGPDYDADAFLREYVARAFQLTFPTNVSLAAQRIYLAQARKLREHVWYETGGRLPSSLASMMATLCARARARCDRINGIRAAWQQRKESGDWDDVQFDSQLEQLDMQFRWIDSERQLLHEWLFDRFPDNWTSLALTQMTPEQRLEARLSLLRRANVDPGAMESLGDTARAAYRLETHARERELAPGAPGAD